MDVEDLLSGLVLGRGERLQEGKQLIYDTLAEVREPWLVVGLFEQYVRTSSGSSWGRSPILEVLLGVREPHERFLMEHLSELLSKGSSSDKSHALWLLGHLIRKSPAWLHRITSWPSSPLLKELLRLLRSPQGEEIPVVLSALLDLITLLPAIPSYMTPYLQELFELFSSLLAWKPLLNPVHRLHLQSILLSYFHRLYGLFPCNFLHYLRSTYAAQELLFKAAIQPMLLTVRLHPLLISHSREQERSNARWKKMELHDVLSESSRYSLLPQEFNNEDIYEEEPSALMLLPEQAASSGGSAAVPVPLDEAWTTETAIEATPETTPFVTPIKDECMLRANRSNRPLRLDLSNIRSPGSLLTSPKSAPLAPSSPYTPSSATTEAATWTEGRRDSIFDRPPGELSSLAKLNKVNAERKSLMASAEKERIPDDQILVIEDPSNQGFLPASANEEVISSPPPLEEVTASERNRTISFCDESNGVLGLCSLTSQDYGSFSLSEKRRKRYHSCPDPSKLNSMPSADVFNVSSLSPPQESEASTQTELKGSSFGYEHLLPPIRSLSQEEEGSALERREVENPHALLDKYLESICSSASPPKDGERKEEVLRSVIASLKSQLLYERNRREILGERNRRLLGKSKSSRILKEENTALRDQLQLVKSEIDDLHRQIEEIRREKHLVEEERSTTARSRDHEIEKRSAEIRALKIDAQKSEEVINELREGNEEKRGELDVCREQFFSIKAEYDVLEQKESERLKTELELIQLREKIHKMGELRHKYLEQLEQPGHNMESEKMHLFKQAYEKDLKTMARTVENKTFEMETFKSRILELEAHSSKKDSQIGDLKKLIKRMQDEQEEVRREYKSTYESMVQLHLQTQSHTLELRAQLAQNTRVLSSNAAPSANNPSSSASSASLNIAKKAHRPTGGLLDFHATRNVDIEQPIAPFGSTTDRSFVVGSPPLSSGGSIGSDKSEVIRRALESNRPIKFEEGESPPRPGKPSHSMCKEDFKSSLNGGNIS